MTVPPGIDVNVPNAARMYDYYLGGKDNFAVDRAAAEAVLSIIPELPTAARLGRKLIGRVVRHMVGELGLKQIVDIGSGLPTRENVHDIAHAIDPTVRVVYVDADEVVCIHGRALLAAADVAMVHGDLCEPAELLGDKELRRLIDLDQPVGLLMMSVLHLIPDADDPYGMVARYRDAVAPGSALAITHSANDKRSELMSRVSAIYESANLPFTPRGREAIAAFFGDWRMEPPGVVQSWPYPTVRDAGDVELTELEGYSGVAVKR